MSRVHVEYLTVFDWIQGKNDGVERNSLDFPEVGSKWYILNAKWFNTWKAHVYANELEQFNEIIDNSDIIIDSKNHWLLENEKILKKDLILQQDYVILPPKAWFALTSSFILNKSTEISKYSVLDKNNETYIELYQKPLTLAVLQKGQISSTAIIYIPNSDSVKNLYVKVRKLFRIHLDLRVLENQIRLWKIDPMYDIEGIKSVLAKSGGKDFPAEIMSNDLKRLEECGLADRDIVMAEMKESDWLLEEKLIKQPLIENQGWNHSSLKYPIEHEVEISNGSSSYGLIGLQNIGNTCFMNSGLQCLSFTKDLTSFIISGDYLSSINTKNPLGSKGTLINEFATLISNLWHSNFSSIQPTQFKRCFSTFAKQFSGSSQHDSQEFLSFLLDGLHEDLNHPKPLQPAQPESALFYWNAFKSKNDSIITNLFFGQLRSTLRCPHSHISLTFDPFLMLSLPLPKVERRYFKLLVFWPSFLQPIVECGFCGSVNTNVADIKMFISGSMNIKLESLRVMNVFHEFSTESTLEDHLIINPAKVCKIFVVESDSNVWIQQRKRKPYDSELSGPLVSYTRVLGVEGVTNLKELHFRVYEAMRDIVKGLLSFEEVIKSQGTDCCNAYTLRFINTNIYNDKNCRFCGNKCNNCLVPFDETQLKQFQNGQEDLELEVLWSKFVREEEFLGLGRLEKHPSVIAAQRLQSNSQHTEVSLDACIQEFAREENLDASNKNFCKECNELVQSSKKMQIWKAPKILIIHLKRFRQIQGGKIKDKRLVEFQLKGLNMHNVCIDQGGIYDLYAISNHYGDLNYGHYTSFAYSEHHASWFEFDDSTVKEIDELSLVSEAAYLLFYRKRDN